ncbi:MAG: hypothetical protein JNL08_01295 [Planctomycetes bacterium]|nr:hypothetical protein [Planctomycetota bacterium]
MNQHDFERRLQAQLDARSDPLDDPDLVAFLAAHPAQLVAFARLCSRLRALPARPAAARRPRRRLPVAVAAAGLAVLATVAAGRFVGRAAPTPRIVSFEWQEHMPRAATAVQFTVRESLLSSPATSLIAYESRSHHR